MTSREGVWQLPGTGRRLAYRVWSPADPKHLLVLVHGYGEHGGRYAPMAEALTRHGIAVAAPDHWGHGRSSGARGDIESVDRVVEDEEAWVEAELLSLAGVPAYSVFGHSFGGLAAIRWAMRQPARLRRLIVQSPLIDVGFPLPKIKVFAARVLRNSWPRFQVAMDLDVSALSHDPAVLEAYRRDPLVHHAMTLRSYFSLLDARDAALAAPEQVRVPTLALLAGQDRIISLEAAQRWYGRLSGEKSLRIFHEAYHELHHEPVRDQTIDATARWVLAGARQGVAG